METQLPLRFRKKPIVIEAVKWSGEYTDWVKLVVGNGWMSSAMAAVQYGVDGKTGCKIFLDTLEGQMRVEVGDYIIRGVKGEFYPCKPDIFEATYEDETEQAKGDHANGLPYAELSAKVAAAMELIERYGQIDEAHHKLWVLDQIARIFQGDEYDRWVLEMKAGEDGPETYTYDAGVAP